MKINIAEPLTKLINVSFANSLYFENLKVSKVIPVFKNKGTLNINKIIEKLMHKRLYSFLCKYNCVYMNQLAFRKHHSTIHALIGITEHCS